MFQSNTIPGAMVVLAMLDNKRGCGVLALSLATMAHLVAEVCLFLGVQA